MKTDFGTLVVMVVVVGVLAALVGGCASAQPGGTIGRVQDLNE